MIKIIKILITKILKIEDYLLTVVKGEEITKIKEVIEKNQALIVIYAKRIITIQKIASLNEKYKKRHNHFEKDYWYWQKHETHFSKKK